MTPHLGLLRNVSPEVVSPGADSQVTSQLLCKENQYKSELETVTQQRNEVFKELEQERDRVVGILSVAGASSDVLDAVHKGYERCEFWNAEG